MIAAHFGTFHQGVRWYVIGSDRKAKQPLRSLQLHDTLLLLVALRISVTPIYQCGIIYLWLNWTP